MLSEFMEVWERSVILLFKFLWHRILCVYYGMGQFFTGMQEGATTVNIMSGNYLLDDSYGKLSERILNMPSVLRALELAKCTKDRICAISRHFPDDEFWKMLTITYGKLSKSDKEAAKLVNKAEFLVWQKNLDLALRAYNLALLFATFNCPFFERIEQGRSQLLERMRSKEGDSSDEEMEKKMYTEQNIFKIQGNENKHIPSAADFVVMKTDNEKGRHLVVTKAVPPGTTVIVECPYSAVSNDGVKWDVKYCARCFAKITRAVVCYGCVFTVYCSEACRLEDCNNGHNYECHCLPYLHALRISPDMHLGLKTVCKAGPATLYNLYMASKKQKGPSRNSKLMKGFDPATGIYRSDSYYQILNLASHIELDVIDTYAFIAVSVVKVLALKTTFFGDVESKQYSGFYEYVATAFLQHCISFQFNSFSVSDVGEGIMTGNRLLSMFQTTESRMMNLAKSQLVTGIYSLLSIMNHSCYPTTFAENLKNGKVAVITNRSLIPGDTLTVCYCYDFTICPISERRSRLLKSYHFYCDCPPCIYNWPMVKEIKSTKKHICPECTDKFECTEIKKIQQCILDEGLVDGVRVMICKKCGQKYNEQDICTSLKYYTAQFAAGKRFVAEDRPIEAISELASCLEYFQRSFCPPSDEVFVTQNLFEKAFQLAVHDQ